MTVADTGITLQARFRRSEQEIVVLAAVPYRERVPMDVIGPWILRDSSADGRILLQQAGASPRLFIVRAAELTRALLALVPT